MANLTDPESSVPENSEAQEELQVSLALLLKCQMVQRHLPRRNNKSPCFLAKTHQNTQMWCTGSYAQKKKKKEEKERKKKKKGGGGEEAEEKEERRGEGEEEEEEKEDGGGGEEEKKGVEKKRKRKKTNYCTFGSLLYHVICTYILFLFPECLLLELASYL